MAQSANKKEKKLRAIYLLGAARLAIFRPDWS
jgi:hypothetical protein